jgi:hypothetical protein
MKKYLIPAVVVGAVIALCYFSNRNGSDKAVPKGGSGSAPNFSDRLAALAHSQGTKFGGQPLRDIL